MAKKIKKILVPTDGSKSATRGLDFALKLTEIPGSFIVCVHVLSEIPDVIQHKAKLEKHLCKKAHQVISKAKSHSAKKGVKIKTVILHNKNKGKTITEYAENEKFDLIVIGSKGPHPIADMFLGSVANYVVNKSKIPVTVVK